MLDLPQCGAAGCSDGDFTNLVGRLETKVGRRLASAQSVSCSGGRGFCPLLFYEPDLGIHTKRTSVDPAPEPGHRESPPESGPPCGKSAPRRRSKRPKPAESLGSFTPQV